MRLVVLCAIALTACGHAGAPVTAKPGDALGPARHAEPVHAAGGTIQGVVVLDSGHAGSTALVGATIVVASAQLEVRRRATTDERGFYQVRDLRPADDYVVTFSFGGLSESRGGVTVTDGARVSVSQKFMRRESRHVPNCSEMGQSDGVCFP